MSAATTPQGSIAIVGKGGAGKTATTGLLGPALAGRGATVALVDFDPDHVLTRWLAPGRSEDAPAVDDWLTAAATLDDVLVPLREGLSLVPAAGGLAVGEHDEDVPAHTVELVQELRRRFDVVLIDTRGAVTSRLTLAALAAADVALIPFPVEGGSVDTTWEAIGRARQVRTPVLGLLPWRPGRTRVARLVPSIFEGAGHRVFSPVRQDVLADETRSVRQLLDVYAPRARALEDYATLADEVIAALAAWRAA